MIAEALTWKGHFESSGAQHASHPRRNGERSGNRRLRSLRSLALMHSVGSQHMQIYVILQTRMVFQRNRPPCLEGSTSAPPSAGSAGERRFRAYRPGSHAPWHRDALLLSSPDRTINISCHHRTQCGASLASRWRAACSREQPRRHTRLCLGDRGAPRGTLSSTSSQLAPGHVLRRMSMNAVQARLAANVPP